MYLTSVALGITFCTSLLLYSQAFAEQVCASCHQKQVESWQQSHHYRAMNEATSQFVLAEFAGQNIRYQNNILTPITINQQYWLISQDDQGRESKEKILYTFGYYPLQQYLIEDEQGSYQFIPLAWDSRKKSEGGQRWFILHSQQQPNQEFHHTQMGQNWNHMCADCHSTNFKKNYSATTQQFNSVYKDINVTCEACHGDTQQHLAWADGTKSIPNKGLLTSLAPNIRPGDEESDTSIQKTRAVEPSKQIEICATCHSRRQQLKDRGQAIDFWDTFKVSLLTPSLYHVDGQILEESYVWGSFLQSKMYTAGVTCSNCHDPHSGELKLEGNQTCNQCHAASKFDTSEHHGHQTASAGSQCVDCHMPATVYMKVDPRRDHSLRVPRPDLSIETNAPNACTDCHDDKSAQWAVNAVKSWHPDSKYLGKPHFSQAFHAADQGFPQAPEMLSRIAQNNQYNDIIRASALSRMENFSDQNALIAIQRAVREQEPLKRLGAISAARPYPLLLRYKLLAPLLTDSRLSIRAGAGRALAALLNPANKDHLSDEQKQVLQRAVDDYRQSERFQSERGYSHTNLGNLAFELEQPHLAERHYRTALDVEPIYLPAYINFADLTRKYSNEKNARTILKRALSIAPDDPDVHYALAMSWIRENQKKQAEKHLKSSALNGNATHKFTYGLFLKEKGNSDAARTQLEAALTLAPNQVDVNYVLMQLYIQQKNYQRALPLANKLVSLLPNEPQMKKIVEELQLFNYLNKAQ